jgi:transcriptional regulator with GAF, ATPase, and Fis domain
MAHVARLARQVAPTATPVLIGGETGTGKEVLARAIHEWSDRADRPLVTVNCAALPESLIESELFGHVRGAFSGATAGRIGRFQAANGGTLFLDEVGEIPPPLQAKLLRVLQDGTLEPVGSDTTVRVDVRILAATNKDLAKAVAEKEFREDLYYRLAVFPIQLPPLRARREDVPCIARAFLASLAARTGRGPWVLTPAGEEELMAGEWPGNVRELVNALERATVLQRGPDLVVVAAPAPGSPRPTRAPEADVVPLADVERSHIERTLRGTNGKVWGDGGAARRLGLHPSTLLSRMKKLGLGTARDWRRDGRDRGPG